MEKPVELNGAWKIDHPLKEYKDFDKLAMPEFKYDRNATEERQEKVASLLQGRFKVEISTDYWSSALLNRYAGELRGIMEIMYDMMDAPGIVHQMMEYFTKAHFSLMNAMENEGIITPGPHMPWYNSNFFGPELINGKHSYKNRWIRMHGQEFDQVSPEMCEEFLFPYQREIAKRYGKVEYGCCENLTRKIKNVLTIPNLAMVACSPYSDLKIIAEAVEDKAVIQWRQNPTDLLFTEDMRIVKKTLENGLDILKHSHFHIALREIMTFNGKPERLKEFITMVRDISSNKI